MNAVWRIAKTEVLEQRRQPWMIFILAANYLLWSIVFGVMYVALDWAMASPDLTAELKRQLQSSGIEFDSVLRIATSASQSFAFTNLPLFVALLAGTSVLHDRECGTMPFLMLAPLTRLQLIAGKLLGVMTIAAASRLSRNVEPALPNHSSVGAVVVQVRRQPFVLGGLSSRRASVGCVRRSVGSGDLSPLE